MFKQKYKDAIDHIKVDEDVLKNTLDCVSAKRNYTKTFKMVLIACLSTTLIFTSIFTSFKLSKSDIPPDIYKSLDDFSSGEISEYSENSNSGSSQNPLESEPSDAIDSSEENNSFDENDSQNNVTTSDEPDAPNESDEITKPEDSEHSNEINVSEDTTTPAEPDEPITSESTETPAEPDEPIASESPETPAEPDEPITSESPEPPAEPDEPIVSESPEPPAEPDEPIVSESPDDTTLPEEPDISNSSTEPENEPYEVPPTLTDNGFNFAENQNQIDKIFTEITITDPSDPAEPEDEPCETVNSNSYYEISNISNTIQASDIRNCDTIKTDDEAIFLLKTNKKKIFIISAKDGNMKVISEIDVNRTLSPKSILLINNTLVIVCSSGNKTTCIYYDVTEKTQPKLLTETSQSGILNNCIAIGENVYLITYLSVNENNINFFQQSALKVNGEDLDYNNVIVSNDKPDSFVIITTFNIKKQSITSKLAILGKSATIYCGNNNIYVSYTVQNSTEPAPDSESATATTNTKILKISFNKGMLIATAAGSVEGTISSSSAMNESESYFRITTKTEHIFFTKRNNGTKRIFTKTFYRVFCLDTNLNVIGVSDNFATNKRSLEIYYVGNVVFLRTVLVKDPIYAIDISDPSNLIARSELEKHGNFDYIKMYGNNFILGLNVDLDSKTGVTKGFDISMYDANNNFNDVFLTYYTNWEESEYLDKDKRYYENGLMLDEENDLIGIPFAKLIFNDADGNRERCLDYKFFHSNNGAISEARSFEFTIASDFETVRTVRIDNILYFIVDSHLLAISTTDFSFKSEIII